MSKLETSLPADSRVVNFDNGLTLILKRDHSAPVATVHAWAKTGSVNEGAWMGAGMSHVLEHMLFKGTKTRKGSQIDQEVQEAGGQMNACTSFNYTLYYIDVPSSGVKVAIDILCDIMQNAVLPPDELEKERQVILREMDMGMDDPDRRSSRRLFETAYQVSPYRCPVIGYRDIFESFTREDLMAYYKRMYAPNNLFMVVVGDIIFDEIEAQVRSAFAQSKRIPIAAEVLPLEPPQIGMRVVEETGPVELCHTHLGWHIPNALHPDIPALGVISVILGVGRSSRLFRKLREETGLVQSIDSWLYTPGDEGLIGISAEIELSKYRDALAAIRAEVQRLQDELIPEVELEKVKKQYLVSVYSSRKTMAGQAADLGNSWFTAADLNYSKNCLKKVQETTPEDIQRIFRTWFTDNRCVLYSLMPQTESVEINPQPTISAAEDIQKIELSSGLRLLLRRDSRLPFVELRTAFEGSLLSEDEADNGRTLMMSRLMIKGTARRTAEQIATEMESLGGRMENWISPGAFGFAAETLRDDFNQGLDLFCDVLRNPTFPAEALELERELVLADLRAEKDQMLPYALKLMRKKLFGSYSFGLSSNGNETSIAAMTRAEIQSHWEKWVTPSNCVLSIFGDIDPEATIAAVKAQLGNWQPKPKAPLAQPKPTLTGIHRLIEEQENKSQAVVIIGYKGVSILDPRIYPLFLLQETCTDLGSRLFMRIRDELALAYYVGAFQQAGTHPGYFCFYAGTQPGREDQVVEEILKQAELLRTNGITAEELTRTKSKLIGQRQIGRQDIGAVAQASALNELIGLGYDLAEREDKILEALTLEQVNEVARDVLNPDNYVISIVKGK